MDSNNLMMANEMKAKTKLKWVVIAISLIFTSLTLLKIREYKLVNEVIAPHENLKSSLRKISDKSENMLVGKLKNDVASVLNRNILNISRKLEEISIEIKSIDQTIERRKMIKKANLNLMAEQERLEFEMLLVERDRLSADKMKLILVEIDKAPDLSSSFWKLR